MSALWLLALLVPDAAPPVSAATDFALRDHAGKMHRLSDWRDREAAVVVFVSVDCPLAKLYAPRLNELAKKYAGKVAFVAVAPNSHDAPADLARFVRQHSLCFPFLKDPTQSVTRAFDARRSPEAFVLDRRRVVYRGRIDDQYAVGLHRSRATKTELLDAIESVLAGKPVAVPVTEAPGCPIERESRPKSEASVTYSRDVAPILQRRCQVCHRPGQSGPFSLLTYEQASERASGILEVIQERRMPPWGADPRHGKFANDPSLSESEKKTLADWIAEGCPEGDPADLPPPRKFPDGWSIPGPDLVVSMPEPITVPAEGVIEYQYVRVDPGFREDRWIEAAEIMPGNAAVVHHCNVFLQPPGVADPENLRETGKLGSYCLTMTAPGTPPTILPSGMAKRIPAGWKIVFVLHYQAVGSVQKDQTKLALKFADPKKVRQEVATKLMYETDLRIPPRESHYVVSQTWQAERDVLLLSLFPHAHLRGKSFRYELIRPDGREEILLDVPRYDFNWQHRYVLAEPLRLGKGSRLRVTAVYDNSADNLANPDPDSEVRTGTQSWEEMFNGYFDVALADEDLTAARPWPGRAWEAIAGVCRPGVALLACVGGGLYLGRKRIAKALRKGQGTTNNTNSTNQDE